MKIMISTVLFFSFFLCLLQGEMIEEETKDYYQILREKALENLSTMPAEKEAEYLELFTSYPDVFMAFFLAYEEGSKLLLADTADLVSHHRRVEELWKESREQYSLPFFLSYIAKITVTDERITPYHIHFEEYGLSELKDEFEGSSLNDEDLVRELNLWCRRYMTFKPTSGRDMAPFDILERTNIGRCEEMQIFFISAARTLGIPARPAMTPLWAHTDNNHAWVEVFVNDTWRYLGAVEPAYELDDAWFSANAARAVMIMATAAFPDTSDVVIREEHYYSTINSTPNYDSDHINSRRVTVVTRDAADRIIPEADIAVMVYNWGMLRPIYRAATDSSGNLDLLTGRGSFFIAAKKDSLFSLTEIPAQPEEEAGYIAEIILQDNQPISTAAVLQYPDPQLPARKERPEWNEYRNTFTESYNKIVASYQELPFPEKEADSLLIEIWQKCRNNKENFLAFYENNNPLAGQFAELLVRMDEKFLWQAEPHQWQNLYDFFNDLDISEYPLDMQALIISPTVLFEELPDIPLKESLTKWRKKDVAERIEEITAHLAENYSVDKEQAVFSLLPFDRAMSLQVLTGYQYKMLACSVLRANQIPASYTRIPDVINIYSDSSWRYYDLSEKSFLQPDEEEIADVLTEILIETVDGDNYPLTLSDGQYTLTFQKAGLFYPSETQPQYDETGNLSVSLEPGKYQIQIGYRISSDETRLYLKEIDTSLLPSDADYYGNNKREIENESVLRITLRLEGYPREWQEITDEIAELLDILSGFKELTNGSHVLLLGDFDKEPVRRTADRLAVSPEERDFSWLGTKASPDAPVDYSVSNEYKEWLLDYPYMRERVLTLHYDDETDRWTFFDGFWERLPD